MISVPVSVAIIGFLALLGVHLTAQQSLMLGAGIAIAVKIFLVLGGYALVTRVSAWLKARGSRQAAETAPAEAEETR